LTDNENLRSINIEFLEHDYDTDVITFVYNNGNIVNGEVYISFDTVRLNAQNYEVSLNEELLRVIIHGVLHLLGHDDITEEEKCEMRKLEDSWMGKRNDY
jgi:rRNA maturation RNase YbeY